MATKKTTVKENAGKKRKEKPEIVWKADLQKNRRSGTIKTM